MKQLTTLLLLFICITVNGQEPSQQKPTLTIVGSARISVKPDLGILNILVSEIRPQMAGAIKALGEKSNHYNELLKKIGFAEKDIKTTSFNVSKNSFYRDDRYVDSGYIASQNIRLEFVYNQQILQKIVGEFSKSEKPIDFGFDFELSEALKQKVQLQVIDIAVKDGQEKAALMAKAAKVSLTSIKSIVYGAWGGDAGMELIERQERYAASAMAAGDGVQSFNFTPDDLVFRDTVTIEWLIEQVIK